MRKRKKKLSGRKKINAVLSSELGFLPGVIVVIVCPEKEKEIEKL